MLSSWRVSIVPVLSDNFSYLLIHQESGRALAVDPAEAHRVLDAAKREGVTIEGVLTTHHHADHAGGNEDMKKALPNVRIWGGDARIFATEPLVVDSQEVEAIAGLKVRVLSSPCHTTGHVLYYVPGNPGCVFTGDTLFVGGCGRFFEGTAAQMHHALNKVIGGLPDDTLVYCGHEYTVANLEFAESVDPQNEAVASKLSWSLKQRSVGAHTVPSTVGEEKRFNPFMHLPSLAPNEAAAIQLMAELREKKNNFKKVAKV